MQVTRRVTTRAGTRTPTRYALTSLPADQATPTKPLKLVRSHWRNANKLHWVRDVAFDEDRCTVRSGNAHRALATVRNGVVGYLHARKEPNIAAALRRCAGRPRAALKAVTQPLRRRTR
jgi:hypothetical protein